MPAVWVAARAGLVRWSRRQRGLVAVAWERRCDGGLKRQRQGADWADADRACDFDWNWGFVNCFAGRKRFDAEKWARVEVMSGGVGDYEQRKKDDCARGERSCCNLQQR
ncbi:hypothetical protein M0R45_006775 [Rubus argutus]|uniref:Uncharacterized protein n=1 Tax=Rubus argutus TaxID=59490 RepID=A0AAW1YRE8_RUBAR